jgi:hypothetical protein
MLAYATSPICAAVSMGFIVNFPFEEPQRLSVIMPGRSMNSFPSKSSFGMVSASGNHTQLRHDRRRYRPAHVRKANVPHPAQQNCE